MTNTVECPHTAPAVRECAGCTQTEDDGTNERWCDGEVTGHVYRDSEGDPGVIGGLHSFLAVEGLKLSCGCTLNQVEEQKVIDALCETYGDEDLDENHWTLMADAASY